MTNEEPRISKKELQLPEEELSNVIHQLQLKIRALESANQEMASLLNCTNIATIVLDRALCIKRFTPTVMHPFKLTTADIGRALEHVAEHFTYGELIRDAQHVLQDSEPREKEVYAGDGRWYVRRIVPFRTTENRSDGVIIAFVDITSCKQTADAVVQRLTAVLEGSADAIITIDRRGIIQSANHAAEQMFGYTSSEMIGQNVAMLMPLPFREFHDSYIAAYLQTGKKHVIGIRREVEAQRKDGSIFPTELSVNEIAHLGLFAGIHRDLSERRRLEREVVEAVSLEQRRIGQDLHDSVGQKLAALNLLTKDLADTLPSDSESASLLLERIALGLQRSQQELRAVLRGLLPVAVDSQGLMEALADLARRTQQEGKIICTFDCPIPIRFKDNLVAIQLFLIAQEAVRNAVKHAQPSSICINLTSDHMLTLQVRDDGIGILLRPEEIHGLGLRIMRNRAAIIGASLTIEPAKPRGTVITCVLGRNGHERQ